jgi:hypothetical protein
MGFEERHTIVGLVLSLVTMFTYGTIVIVRAVTDGLPLTDVAWQGPLLLTIGIGGGLYAVLYVVGLVRARGQTYTDVRDAEIRARSESAASSLTSMGALAALIMLALGVEAFWVAHTLLILSWLGSLAGAGVAIDAYRGGIDR